MLYKDIYWRYKPLCLHFTQGQTNNFIVYLVPNLRFVKPINDEYDDYDADGLYMIALWQSSLVR